MAADSTIVEMMEKELARKRDEVVALEQALSVLRGDTITSRGLLNLPKTREYEGLGIVDSVKRLLTEKGPQNTREIADELLDRGIKTRSKNYVATVYATLENSPSFKRSKDGNWVLVD